MVVEYVHLLHLSQDRRQRIDENFLKTSNQNIRKFEFRILSEIWMKVRVNECSRNREIRVIEIRVFESFFA